MNTIDSYPDLMTITEVANYLRCSYKTAYKLVKSGKIKSKKIGQQYRIHKDVLIAYCAS